MRRILVFQHAAHEILGTLNPLLKENGLRIRYVNFQREPNATPTLEGYNGLIILGGMMGVYEHTKYPHLKLEMKIIEEAVSKNLPVLGVCLGAQLIAQVLGSHVRKHVTQELGWSEIHMTKEAPADTLLTHFQKKEYLFHLHGDTFDIPKSAVHLARSEACESQAFRYQSKVYGLQFHLEVDKAMIHRWLNVPEIKKSLDHPKSPFKTETILQQTDKFIENSLKLSTQTFTKFAELFGKKERVALLGSDHGGPAKLRKI